MTGTQSPVALVPVLLDKPWGGDALGRWGLPVAPGARIGEAWMFADISSTSASGAGGGAFHSLVAGGPTRHYSLRDLAADLPNGIAGQGVEREHPLLIKLLHAKEHLSVQVHPSPAYAAAHPDARLKAESWHVLYAEPGAELFLGLVEGTQASDVERLAREGRVAEVLTRVPAVAGDCHTLPSGLVHAMGAGVVVAEVQTASDTTFRLYDWAAEFGRTPRELHIREAVAAMLPDARVVTERAASVPAGMSMHAQRLAEAGHFTITQRFLAAGHTNEVAAGAILLAISGFGTVSLPEAARPESVAVTPSQAVFAPSGGVLTTPTNRSLTWLEAELPR